MGTDAKTVNDPATLLAVNPSKVALPVEFVLTTLLPARTTLAPELGTVNVTGVFVTGLLNVSVTRTFKPLAKLVLTVVDCLSPAVIMNFAAAPARFVNVNESVILPLAVTFTL